MYALCAAIQPFGMESRVDIGKGRGGTANRAQGRLERASRAPSAFGTWTVSRGESRDLVEEEELGVASAPHLPLPPFERGEADQPSRPAPRAARHLLFRVVKASAPIPEHQATRRRGDQLSERGDPVPQRHVTVFWRSIPSRSRRSRLALATAARRDCPDYTGRRENEPCRRGLRSP